MRLVCNDFLPLVYLVRDLIMSWLVLVLLLGVFVFAFWLYTYLTCGVCKSSTSMYGKTVLITGCNSGIGKHTAIDLAKRGARVIMACRNVEKAKEARKEIIDVSKNNMIYVKECDVSSLKSVRKFAEEIKRAEERLDVLIHNAGISLKGRHVTDEGLQLVWATNFFGPFLLTHLIIDLLKKADKGRIVYVSSVLHKFGGVSLKKPNPVEDTRQGRTYCSSKFAGLLFTTELARRLEGTGVTANSLHPGIVKTPIWDKTPAWMHIPMKPILPFLKTEEQGAQTTIHLAVSEELDGVTGKYFSDCKEAAPSSKTQDEGLAKKFWEECEKIVQLKPTDPHI